jgi:hypothetical protein
MLANLRRKVGMVGMSAPATMPPPSFAQDMIVSPTIADPAMPPPFTMEELGFVWPRDRGIFSPSAIPPWLREQVRQFFSCDECHIKVLCLQSLADLGLPVNGADGIFVQMNEPSGWGGDFAPMPEAW